MKAVGVHLADLDNTAQEIGVRLYDLDGPSGRKSDRYQFRLALDSGSPLGQRKYQRLSANNFMPQRRVAAVCWHGHRDFFRALFKRCPDAQIVTAVARYHGREDFETKFEATGDQNIGSQWYPMLYRDACECQEGVGQ